MSVGGTVSGTLKIGQLINWSTAFLSEGEAGDWYINYYAPDGRTMYKIKLDDASKAALKAKRDQIVAFCNQDIMLSGTVEEIQKLQLVTHTTQVLEWVKQ